MFGYIIVISYCLSVASSTILIQEGSTEKSLIVLAGALLGVLFYGIINYKQLPQLIQKIKNNKRNIIAINIATSVGWLFGYFYGLEYIEAPILLCIEMATIPIVSFLVSIPPRDYPKHIPTITAIICSIISMILIIRQNILLGAEVHSYLMGTFMGILAGIGTSYIGVFSGQLTNNKFYPSEVLMSRLFLLIPISLFLAIKRNAFTSITYTNLKVILLSSFMAGIFSSFLYQKSLQTLGVMIVSTLIPFTPVFAYFIRVYLGKQPFQPYIFLAITFCTVMICSMNILMQPGHKKHKQ